MATLFVVSTPIGNLDDLTRRAGAVLAQVARILAEDTRRTRTLLQELGISTVPVSCHAHNETGRIEQVSGWLRAGEDVALVSDAGTPLLSDPGERLVRSVIEAGFPVVPIPGVSAVTAALAASGLPTTPFSFLGFAPRKGADRQALLDRVALSEETTVLFESPARLHRLLEDLRATCGGDRRVAVARELTKVHEEFVRGTLSEACRYYQERRVRGEVTVVISPASIVPGADSIDRAAGLALAKALLDSGSSPSRTAREVARRLGLSRNEAYALVQEESDS